jgi:hypothetical protein
MLRSEVEDGHSQCRGQLLRFEANQPILSPQARFTPTFSMKVAA